MAILIRSVTIAPNELMTGEPFFISARVEEASWNLIKNEYQNWNEVKSNFENWNTLKNFNEK